MTKFTYALEVDSKGRMIRCEVFKQSRKFTYCL